MNLFEVAAECERQNKIFALVTIVGTSGRTPRHDGRMLVLPDGRFYGTIGGGTAERSAITLALKALASGCGRLEQIQVRQSGMIDVYIDIPIKGRKAVIFGTGHIATAIANLLFGIGFQIFFVDPHALSNGFRCPENMTLVTSPTEVSIDNRTAVIFSNPEDRDKYIDLVLETDCPYIGVLSSKSRPTLDNKRIFQPIGLDIGAETPEEIAISIAAQVLAVLNGKL